MATHAASQFDAFPILEILGETNTGKNCIMWPIRRFGCRAREPLVLRGTRLAVLRDFLIETRGAVAIIDEGDSMMDQCDFEQLLKCRSRKEQGQITINRATDTGKAYKRETRNIYGPLVVHRQTPFQDASLATRSITIHTSSNLDRAYGRPVKSKKHIEVELELKQFEMEGAPRIAENWLPLSSVANHVDDSDFLVELLEKLTIESVEMIREAQAVEPTRLVLDGALALSFDGINWKEKRWRLVELSEWLRENHLIVLSPRQIGNILRGHKLGTTKSCGYYVMNFQPRQLQIALEAAHDTDDELYPLFIKYLRRL